MLRIVIDFKLNSVCNSVGDSDDCAVRCTLFVGVLITIKKKQHADSVYVYFFLRVIRFESFPRALVSTSRLRNDRAEKGNHVVRVITQNTNVMMFIRRCAVAPLPCSKRNGASGSFGLCNACVRYDIYIITCNPF